MSSSHRSAPAPRRRVGAPIGAVLALLLAACAQATSPQPPMTDASGSAGSAELRTLVRAVSEDAQRLSGVDAARVRVLEAAAVTWSDGSLGCPAPDRFYTQALVPGYRVRIEAAGRIFIYHANARGDWTLCPAERASQPVGAGRA